MNQSISKGVRPPMPGENDFYHCHACGERFSAKVPLPGILALFTSPQCPKCGSHQTGRDLTIVH